MAAKTKPVLAIGRIVHFNMLNVHGEHACRPAIITRIWGNDPYPPGVGVQLQVFTDGSNDGPEYASGVVWRTSQPEQPKGSDLGWHWPEDCD